MTVQYDGTNFAGFQVQTGQRTVQGVLETALRRITGESIRIVGAGRTDRGVHATGQVISFQSGTSLAPRALQHALNAVLPEDVAIITAAEAEPGFHARFSARAREYRYTIWNAAERPVLGRQYVLHWRAYLDAAAMDRAAQVLVGEHDFAAFAGASEASERPRRTIRTMYRLHCWRDGHRVIVQAVADAFLPHMVRNVVGTLLLVGMHRASVEDVARILASRDRRQAGATIPPRGLCLTRVEYD